VLKGKLWTLSGEEMGQVRGRPVDGPLLFSIVGVVVVLSIDGLHVAGAPR
jgi:hypothetical protein